MEAQKDHIKTGNYGGTMRLGSYKAVLKKGSIAARAYGAGDVSERHRHRYEVNQEFVPVLEKEGLTFSGKSPDGQLCEIAELPCTVHPFFVGTQFHPEFTSRPHRPHPLFREFVKTAKSKK
jgi:CTP synthase